MDKNKTLSPKEEEIMNCFWHNGPLFVREIVDLLPEPRPHFNTVSTFVRGLETKGWLEHRQLGNSFQYIPLVSISEYRASTLSRMVDRLFGRNYLSFVSTLVKDEKISTDELRELIDKVESHNTQDNQEKK